MLSKTKDISWVRRTGYCFRDRQIGNYFSKGKVFWGRPEIIKRRTENFFRIGLEVFLWAYKKILLVHVGNYFRVANYFRGRRGIILGTGRELF